MMRAECGGQTGKLNNVNHGIIDFSHLNTLLSKQIPFIYPCQRAHSVFNLKVQKGQWQQFSSGPGLYKYLP